jgi:hypothetical protein
MRKNRKSMLVQFGRLCLALLAGLLFRSAWVDTALADEEGPLAPLAAGDGLDNYAELAIGVPYEDRGNMFTNNGVTNIIYGKWLGLDGAGNQEWMQGVNGLEGVTEDSDQFGYSLTVGDFNGDNLPDLAIGVPYEDVGAEEDAGVVQILYGTVDGLSSTGTQTWDQDDAGGPVEAFDHYGYSLAAGDFDCNGYDDLAIGAPFEDLGSISNAGSAVVLYGSGFGLTSEGNQLWHQDRSGIPGVPEEGDNFGKSLAAGDFNGDGCDDLAAGVPSEDVSTISDAGAVNIFYGSESGLSSAGSQIWDQGDPTVLDEAETNDFFGHALATGDFSGDGYDDLAIGVPFEDDSDALGDTGLVNVLYGSDAGLTATNDQVWSQEVGFIPDEAELTDRFGYSLTTGDFNNDTYDDLVVGVPYESLDAHAAAGAIHVIYGSAGRLTTVGNQMFSLEVDEMGDFDNFGWSLAAGHFNGDAFDDLAIGAPRKTIDGNTEAGQVNIICGFFNGLVMAGAQTWTQDSTGILGSVEEGDYFGWSLAALELDSYRTYLPLVFQRP